MPLIATVSPIAIVHGPQPCARCGRKTYHRAVVLDVAICTWCQNFYDDWHHWHQGFQDGVFFERPFDAPELTR